MRNQEIINPTAPNMSLMEPSKSIESFRGLRAYSSESAVMALREFLNFAKDSKVENRMEVACQPRAAEFVSERVKGRGSENARITHQDLPAVGTIGELNKWRIDEFIERFR